MNNEKPKEEKPKVDKITLEAIQAEKNLQIKTNSIIKK